ncbi:MAG TPA: DUF3592 domain-containing protein [Pseudonocardia sp.]
MADHTRMIDELADLVGPAARAIVHARARIVLGLAVVITLLCAFALAGAAVDDQKISANEGVAKAEVLDGSTFFRTLVRFTIANGEVRIPELGVAYPRGLTPGTSVDVEYDLADPDLVRVAGATAFTAAAPLVIAIVVTWAVLLPVARRMRRRRTPPQPS